MEIDLRRLSTAKVHLANSTEHDALVATVAIVAAVANSSGRSGSRRAIIADTERIVTGDLLAATLREDGDRRRFHRYFRAIECRFPVPWSGLFARTSRENRLTNFGAQRKSQIHNWQAVEYLEGRKKP
jgi:hypothetical protein